MDKESYEKQNPFAGEKKPSMKRRCAGHDYTERQMYMVTLTTEGRRPLFGVVTGRSDAPAGHHDAPKVELSQLGQRVVDCWHEIAVRYPEITIVALQMMPDHLHGILFVKRQMQKPLGKVILGFKQGCNKAFRQLVPSAPSVPSTPSVALVPSAPSVPSTPSVALVPSAPSVPPTPSVAHVPSAPSVPSTPSVALVPSVAVLQQPTGLTTPSQHADRNHGLLFAPGYNDKLLLRQGQLQRWLHYLQDNPRRLLMKREHPDLFRVQRGLTVGTQQFSAIGNRFLLDRPLKIQVQCSRRLTTQQIEAETTRLLALARNGAVLVSPSISPGEKSIMRAAFNEGLPLIILQENGFTDLAKPGGQRMDACARGQLLLLAPWEHHNERLTITRNQCLSLNESARMICEQ